MKNSVKYLGLMILALAIMVGCRKNTETGAMTVKMKDAPILFEEVNVEVLQVSVHYNDDSQSGWVDLPTNDGIYNLLELQNGVTTVIANETSLPVGNISQMRLILGHDNSVVIDGNTFPLEMSSQYNTGIKLNVNTEIMNSQTVELLLDFDANESIVVEGEDRFKLKPVIKVESVIYL